MLFRGTVRLSGSLGRRGTPGVAYNITLNSRLFRLYHNHNFSRNSLISSASFIYRPIISSSFRRNLVTTPTLGPQSGTKIINPIKTEDGNILKVNVSQSAADKLNELREQENNPELILRISVESGGCHGFQYIFALKNTSDIDPNGGDSVFERDNAKIVIDGTSLEILRDSTVDYTTELIGSQFKVVNSPYATSSCGCGSSFAFDPAAAVTATAKK